MMKVRIEKLRGPVSLQDGGRPGLAHLGIPLGGFADRELARMANRLVENLDNAPLLECTFGCPDVVFEETCVIAWTGAIGDFFIDGLALSANRRLLVEKGSMLKGNVFRKGLRGYLSIAGKWNVATWRGSVSPVLFGDHFYPDKSLVVKGQELEVDQGVLKGSCFVRFDRLFEDNISIDLYEAPETHLIIQENEGAEQFLASQWEVSAESSRMGIRLEGEHGMSASNLAMMRSVPVLAGTVQLLPGSGLIVSHVDGQTIGGYPRVGWVDRHGLDLLAQAVPGRSVIRFSRLVFR